MAEEFRFEVDGNPFAIAYIEEVGFVSWYVEVLPFNDVSIR